MTHLLMLLTVCTSLVVGQVVELPSELDMAAGLMERGKTFARIGDWENALEYLEPYILVHPEDAEARLLLAECYFNWPDKRVVGDSTVDLNQERGEVQIRILANLGDEGFEMLLKGLHSDTWDMFYACCQVLSEKKDRRAIDHLIKVVQGTDTGRALEALDALVAIESGREQIDRRVVQALTSVLQRPDARWDLRTDAARAAAALRIKEAVPILKRELERIAAALPTAEREDRSRGIEQIAYFIDAVAGITPQDLEACAGPIVERMAAADADDLFKELPRVRPAHQETLAFFAKTALQIIEADPGAYRGQARSFLRDTARDVPGVLLRNDLREHLHKLCDAPQRGVRLQVVEILGNIRDEDALPILLPRLQAAALPFKQGVPIPPRGHAIFARRGRSGDQWFAWGSDEAYKAWEAVQAIGSPRTSDFLLEKLESDDPAWVYTATSLLHDLGEGRAIEPLKRRYAEMSGRVGTEDVLTIQVLERIVEAYLSLSGRPITESGT